jgi:hypothetical protein
MPASDSEDDRSSSSSDESSTQVEPIAKKSRVEEEDGGSIASAVPAAALHLPSASRYEKSFSHVDVVTKALFTATDFLLTSDRLGQIKFWKVIVILYAVCFSHAESYLENCKRSRIYQKISGA